MKRTAWLILILLSANPAARAGDVEDVEAAAQLWLQTIGRHDPDAMVALYDEDAVLLGTTSPILRHGPQAIREYFAQAALVPDLRMQFDGPMNIRVFGDIGINSGFYSVSLTENGATRTIPLRYSFVYRKRDGSWKIINHHSSTLPAQNPTPQREKGES